MFTGWLRGSRTILAVWLLEAALVGAVLVPVARSARVRTAWGALGRARQVALGSMLVCALAAQFALGTRLFPFVDWRMYSAVPSGDPVVLQYDVVLDGGRRDALVPGRYLGPESADRLMEGLRRASRPVASRALVVLARMYEGGRVRWVVVSARRVRIADGSSGPARELWRVRVP
jgi:hypothetical protein